MNVASLLSEAPPPSLREQPQAQSLPLPSPLREQQSQHAHLSQHSTPYAHPADNHTSRASQPFSPYSQHSPHYPAPQSFSGVDQRSRSNSTSRYADAKSGHAHNGYPGPGDMPMPQPPPTNFAPAGSMYGNHNGRTNSPPNNMTYASNDGQQSRQNPVSHHSQQQHQQHQQAMTDPRYQSASQHHSQRRPGSDSLVPDLRGYSIGNSNPSGEKQPTSPLRHKSDRPPSPQHHSSGHPASSAHPALGAPPVGNVKSTRHADNRANIGGSPAPNPRTSNRPTQSTVTIEYINRPPGMPSNARPSKRAVHSLTGQPTSSPLYKEEARRDRERFDRIDRDRDRHPSHPYTMDRPPSATMSTPSLPQHSRHQYPQQDPSSSGAPLSPRLVNGGGSKIPSVILQNAVHGQPDGNYGGGNGRSHVNGASSHGHNHGPTGLSPRGQVHGSTPSHLHSMTTHGHTQNGHANSSVGNGSPEIPFSRLRENDYPSSSRRSYSPLHLITNNGITTALQQQQLNPLPTYPDPPHLGTYVYPDSPFPLPITPVLPTFSSTLQHIVMPPPSYSLTVLIPSSHLLASIPAVPSLWGSQAVSAHDSAEGLAGYTDDSDIRLMVLHAAFTSLEEMRRYKNENRDLSVKLVWRGVKARFKGTVGGTRAGSGGMLYGMDASPSAWKAAEGESTVRSASWGTSHDGGALEVVKIEWLSKGEAHSRHMPNRKARMRQYTQERARLNLLPKNASASTSLPPSTSAPTALATPAVTAAHNVLPAPGRVRGDSGSSASGRSLSSSSTLTSPEETVVELELEDGESDGGKLSLLMGFGKEADSSFAYDPISLQSAIFSSVDEDRPSPKKRRRMGADTGDDAAKGTTKSRRAHAVVLLNDDGTHLLERDTASQMTENVSAFRFKVTTLKPYKDEAWHHQTPPTQPEFVAQGLVPDHIEFVPGGLWFHYRDHTDSMARWFCPVRRWRYSTETTI